MCMVDVVIFYVFVFVIFFFFFFFFSSRRRHTRSLRDWSSDVCSSDLRTTNRSAAARCRIRACLPARLRGVSLHRPAPRGSRSGAFHPPPSSAQIGRASCRERV